MMTVELLLLLGGLALLVRSLLSSNPPEGDHARRLRVLESESRQGAELERGAFAATEYSTDGKNWKPVGSGMKEELEAQLGKGQTWN